MKYNAALTNFVARAASISSLASAFALAFLLLSSCDAPLTPGVAFVTTPPRGSELPYPVYRKFEQIKPLFEQYNDTTYVINFWATWCKPCVEELPLFEKLAQEYRNEPVKVVLVSMDQARDLEGKLLNFVQENKISSSVVVILDEQLQKWKGQVDKRWGGQIPVTLIYRRDIRTFAREQFSTYFDLDERVRPIVGKKKE